MRRSSLGLGMALVVGLAVGLNAAPARQATIPSSAPAASPAVQKRLDTLKAQAVKNVDGMHQFTQQMIDQIFSYGELGFQEVETSKYITDVLRKNGFTVQEGIAGIPTAWVATWGSGKPVIALGSDLDCIPQASQKPGVPRHDPIVAGAPGHGEGHNSGQAVNITAALAVKKIMEEQKLPGTIMIWPGVAEEDLGSKAYFVRAGVFQNVDLVLFSHVANNLSVSWGGGFGSGLVSVEYDFKGLAAHAAMDPWRGHSALDAAELMDVGWQFRREHLRLQQRSHSVIPDGGDQPNVVPPTASDWYYFREIDYPHIMGLWAIGNKIAQAAAMMTDTSVSWHVLGAAWPSHMNKTVAETMDANIQQVGLPKWDDADQALARDVQKMLDQPAVGLATTLSPMRGPTPPERNMGGPSDDVGDISWNVPTVTLRYPSNIPELPGHNWANAISMATPIAHKGATAGAKVQAMTMLDFLLRPELVQQAWDYFRNVQTKDVHYQPIIRAEDKPAIWLNKATMDKYRPEMRKYYFDPTKYKTYLEQLGIPYPPPASATEGGGGR